MSEFEKLYNEQVAHIFHTFRCYAGEYDDAELAAASCLFALCDLLIDTDIDLKEEFGFVLGAGGPDKEDTLYIEFASFMPQAIHYAAKVIDRFKTLFCKEN